MKNRIPDYLKLHVEETGDAPSGESLPEFERLQAAFPAATGCRLEVQARRITDLQLAFPWRETAPPQFQVTVESAGSPGATKSKPQERRALGEALTELLNKLGQARHALRRREAELATAVPVISVSEDGQHLADRLEAVLRGAAHMLHCFGAGLYLLDEATTCLKLRAHYGLDGQALVQPPRRLEEAIADIEAMAGHAVVVEDSVLLSHWNIPAPCGSAICVPVSSPTTILGTLWFFHEASRDFTPTEQNLAEMTAGRLASDLERNVLIQEIRQLRGSPGAAPGGNAQARPTADTVRVPPLVDGWDVAEGATGGRAEGGFCHWHLASADLLHLTVGCSPESQPGKELSRVALQAALVAHVQHEPGVAELFAQVNQSLWTASAGGSPACLFHATLDPTSGVLHYGCLGSVHAYVLRPHCWEPLLGERSGLGTDEELQIQVRQQVLMPGDVLVAVSSGEGSSGAASASAMNPLAETLLRNTHLSAQELADLAARTLARADGGPTGSAVLVGKREEAFDW